MKAPLSEAHIRNRVVRKINRGSFYNSETIFQFTEISFKQFTCLTSNLITKLFHVERFD